MVENPKMTVDVVRPILRDTYGKSAMVDALTNHLADLLDVWPAVDGSIHRTREETIMHVCWSWFPGGDTAAGVAEKIEKALP